MKHAPTRVHCRHRSWWVDRRACVGAFGMGFGARAAEDPAAAANEADAPGDAVRAAERNRGAPRG